MFDWAELRTRLATSAGDKLRTPSGRIFWSAFGAGVVLSFATLLALQVAVQSGQGWLGALVFPVGFVLVTWLRLELVTGSFLTLTFSRAGIGAILRYWSIGLFGHIVGAGLIVAAIVGLQVFGDFWTLQRWEWVLQLSEIKVGDYRESVAYLGIPFIKGILCNILVCLAVILALLVEGYGRKMLVSWMPIFLFVALGFEHLVVNLFLIPYCQSISYLVGGEMSFLGAMWEGVSGNIIPVLLGNMVGAFLLGWYIRVMGREVTEPQECSGGEPVKAENTEYSDS